MADKFNIALVTVADYDGYNRLMEIVNSYHYEMLPDVFLPGPLPMLTRHEYTLLIERVDHCIIGAYNNNDLCGVVQARRLEIKLNSIFKSVPATHIDEIVVDPAFRRRGLARKLLTAAEKWALEQGSSYVSLTVLEFNETARSLYGDCGYVTRSRTMKKPLRAVDVTGEADET